MHVLADGCWIAVPAADLFGQREREGVHGGRDGEAGPWVHGGEAGEAPEEVCAADEDRALVGVAVEDDGAGV